MRIAICSSPAYLDMTILLVNELCNRNDVFLVIEFHCDPNMSVWESEDFVAHEVLATGKEDVENFLGPELRELIDPRVNVAVLSLSSMRIFSPARWNATMQLIRYLKKIDAEVVDIHSLHAVFAMPCLGSMIKVLTLHDPVQHTGEASWGAEFHKQFGMRCADRIIVHDRQSVRLLNKNGHARDTKVATVPLGVYTIYKHWIDPSVKEEKNTVLFFGRISPYKGLEYLLQAVPLIAREIPDVKIVIAGQGDLASYQKLVRNTECYEVHNNYIPNRTAVRYFQRAACVVLPYTQATQSGVLMTAFALGKPVIVTDRGGLPEVVHSGETGLVVASGDSEGMARAVVGMLSKPDLREKMKERIRELAETTLSWRTIAKQTEATYRA